MAYGTLNAGTITPGSGNTLTISEAITLTGVGTVATGDVYYRAADGKLTQLATGADGTVLTSTGAGAVPAFEAIPSQEAFASGTKMLFNQTAAPTGWTKVTGSGNDHALRLTTGTVGTGGSVAFETAFASQTPTATSGAVSSHGLIISEMPSHMHNWAHGSGAGGNSSGASPVTGHNASGQVATAVAHTGAAVGGFAQPTGGSGGHTHGFTQPSISAINLDVSYVDVIIATKD